MGEVIARKPRASKIYKITIRAFRKMVPYAKYAILPTMFAASLFFTEPRPRIWELIDPFTQ